MLNKVLIAWVRKGVKITVLRYEALKDPCVLFRICCNGNVGRTNQERRPSGQSVEL